MDMNETGRFLSELRKQRGLKQKEVADAIQVSDKAISRWETGKGIPDIDSLKSLSDFYGVSIDEILAGNSIKKNELEHLDTKKVNQKLSKLRKQFVVSMSGNIGLLILLGISLCTRPDTKIETNLNESLSEAISSQEQSKVTSISIKSTPSNKEYEYEYIDVTDQFSGLIDKYLEKHNENSEAAKVSIRIIKADTNNDI